MKKFLILLLALVLVLAIPVSAAGNLVYDGENLLTDSQILQLEAQYAQYPELYGFTPILVTTTSFDGMSAADYAGNFYDTHGFPEDGILFLVSFTEGEWYILTNGLCYETISDATVEDMGEELADILREGNFYEAFSQFPELTSIYFEDPGVFDYVAIVTICVGIGLVIGLIVVGIMALMMKSVGAKHSAADYVRSGSMHISGSRDIFLYSQVTRTPKPKNTSSSSSGRSGGGSRGGAGGRL